MASTETNMAAANNAPATNAPATAVITNAAETTADNSSRYSVLSCPVAYHEDAGSLFAALGGTTAPTSVLLESADISTKQGVNSLAVLSASLTAVCDRDTVIVTPLTETGKYLQAHLGEVFADQLIDASQYSGSVDAAATLFRFPEVAEVDERRRLKALSTIDIIRELQKFPATDNPDLPFVAGGFAFDYLASFESLPEVADSANTFPDYAFCVAEIILSLNHETGEGQLKALVHEEFAGDMNNRLATLRLKAANPITTYTAAADTTPEVVQATAFPDDASFCDQIVRLKDHITSGDIYQVVPARQYHISCPDAFAAYRTLRAANPSPYMFYVRGIDLAGNEYELFGASPESNLKYTAATNEVELYPIAGTRPRGLNPDGSINHELDTRNELQLRTDAKEIAEHTMLVDLARNDLARVAVPATRRVADLHQVDRYSRVMHLVSRVVAQLHPDFDALDAYRACMNMGTLTGAPKLMAATLIRQEEKKRRGSYGGAVGYVKANGDMDTAIVIRSAFVSNDQAIVQAGMGVVRDSNPQSEADESLAKAYAVLDAICAAQGSGDSRPQLKVVR